MQDRRAGQRQKTYLGAMAAFNQQYSAMDCLVRNLSSEGAHIVFAAALTLPHEFEIRIPFKDIKRHARIVWRDSGAAGIQFIAAPADNVVSLSAANRIRRLETERDTLKRRIAQLTG